LAATLVAQKDKDALTNFIKKPQESLSNSGDGCLE
jgi:hypothetical protein